ncbi:hypothetical protein BH10BAC5_BH10BAC5_08080 [soil metagenome]
MILISVHGDTNFNEIKLYDRGDSYEGHLDNYVGVFTAMKAFFSGEMSSDNVKMVITYGEEIDMAGAREEAAKLTSNDIAIVMDVTATPTEKDFVIEKCENKSIRKILDEELKEFSYDIYEGCPDPVSNMDECEIYRKKTDKFFFLGIPVFGGDYNAELVSVKKRTIDETAKALIKICKVLEEYQS